MDELRELCGPCVTHYSIDSDSLRVKNASSNILVRLYIILTVSKDNGSLCIKRPSMLSRKEFIQTSNNNNINVGRFR